MNRHTSPLSKEKIGSPWQLDQTVGLLAQRSVMPE